MELERENFTRSDIEQYLGFIWNYEKEVEEGERGDKDKILAYKNSDRNRSYQENLRLVLIGISGNSTFQTLCEKNTFPRLVFLSCFSYFEILHFQAFIQPPELKFKF